MQFCQQDRSGALCLVKNAGLLGFMAGQVCSPVTLCVPQWLTFSSGLLKVRSTCWACVQSVSLKTWVAVCARLLPAHGTWPPKRWWFVSLLLVLCGLWPPSGTDMSEVRGRQGNSLERSTSIAGGAPFFLGRLTTLLAPAPYATRGTVQRFWGPEFPTNVSRWEYRRATLGGWIGGFFLLTGGLLIKPQLYANRLAETLTTFPSNPDFSRKVPFCKVNFL